MDFARHRDFSVIIPAVVTPLLNREVPWVIELSKVPTRQQEQILWAILDHWKKIRARWTAALDATGPGLILAEYTADRYGRPSRSARPMLDRRPNRVDYAGGHVHEVMLTPKWYAEHMPAWVDSFEDGTASYPRDEALEQDFRAVEEINGVPRVPEIRRKDLKDPDLYRHGDAAIAAALMWYASRQALGAIDWQAAPDKHERWDGKDDSRQWHDTPPRRETPGVGKGGAW
jgi:phage FluMu gp28-like protein